jgi:predicted exporter
MTPDRAVAHFVTHHRRGLTLLVLLVVAACVLILVKRGRFASDVLDLLPQGFDSVQVFKQFDREFSQAREITYAIVDDTGEVDLDGFIDHFAALLRAEPWIVRVMEKSPMESLEGLRDVPALAAPLLLNLPPEEFANAIGALDPAAIDARLHKLRSVLESGSPKADFDLQFDPLGIVGPALKPLAGSFSVEQTRPLASPDGKLRVLLALTTQSDLGAHACQATMRSVDAFNTRALAAWPGAKPRVLVTGRTAYVGELSAKMRNDVLTTLATSAALVAAMFWIGFRRTRPLFSILHTLMLCCVVAVAVGAVAFRELNMITIGLCSILIGLGVDFGMLLFGIYQVERENGLDHEAAIAAALRSQARSIIFGALTTAVAFLCLLRSGCSGFMQLGVLIAVGIVFAGAFMMTVFFVFLGETHRPQRRDVLRVTAHRWLGFVYAQPRACSLAALGALALLAIGGAAPLGHLRFEANPKTLEPRHSRAGEALRTIQTRMPGLGEPLIAVVAAPDAATFHEHWAKLQAQWSKLVVDGRLKSVNSPAAFALSPGRVQANATTLAAHDLAASRRALDTALTREGFTANPSATAMLDALGTFARGESTAHDWRRALPRDSPWWFVLDRFFGTTPNLGVAYLTPAKPLASYDEKETLRTALVAPGVDVHFSGWSYTLTDLVPWSHRRLVELSAIMIVFNTVLLAFLFRSAFPLALLMGGLGLSIGALIASLKLLGVSLNLFNVLAFPLVLGVGVDYGIYIVIAARAADPLRELRAVAKPVLLSGLTTVAGFASLVSAENPALRSLGAVCALGVGWCLFTTFALILPASVWRAQR